MTSRCSGTSCVEIHPYPWPTGGSAFWQLTFLDYVERSLASTWVWPIRGQRMGALGRGTSGCLPPLLSHSEAQQCAVLLCQMLGPCRIDEALYSLCSLSSCFFGPRGVKGSPLVLVSLVTSFFSDFPCLSPHPGKSLLLLSLPQCVLCFLLGT